MISILLGDEAEHRFKWEMERAECMALDCENRGDDKGAEEWLNAAIWFEKKLLATLEERQRKLWQS